MIQLHHGDCLSIMAAIPDNSADAVVMDPPFTAAGGSTNGRVLTADTQFFRHWMRSVLAEVRRVVRPTGCGFIFCDWRTIADIREAIQPISSRVRSEAWAVSQALVWDRESMGMGSPFRNCYEMIAFCKGPEWSSTLDKSTLTVIRHRWPYTGHEFHGAEKPVDLCRQLVRWALPDHGTILDPFMGSGTVGVAAIAEGRDYIGIEMEEDAYATAERRIQHAEGGAPARKVGLFGGAA